jgi:hypothetical protein
LKSYTSAEFYKDSKMGTFFDLFPKTKYTFSDKKYPSYQLVTNLLFRTAFIKEVINNTSAYLQYTIKDGDTPEILAAKVYKDPGAYWIILYANEIVDPQFDWPLNSDAFYKYMVDKYRAKAEADEGAPMEDYEVIAWTQNTLNPNSVHHYEKVVIRENKTEQTISEFRYVINEDILTDNDLSVPYDYYLELPTAQSYEPIDFDVDGQTVVENVYGNAVTYYDYENEMNEKKREIKIVKNEFYTQIVQEFEALTRPAGLSFLRRVT